jgi:hypothetical protein
MKNNLVAKIVLLAALFAASISPVSITAIPITGAPSVSPEIGFTPNVSHPLATEISDAGVFDYPVVQQPSGEPGYVSAREGRVTQFGLATRYGSEGFLAHNTLAGSSFFDVEMGDTIAVSYADGTMRSYQVTQIRHLQATRPNSPTSNFVDLENKNAGLTAVQLFYQTYGVEDTLILQTCIANGSVLSWGRLFIIAEPVQISAFAQ